MHPIDILYTPLDIPELPNIDMPKLREWIKISAPIQELPEPRIDAKNALGPNLYPWNLVYCKVNYEWYNNFNILFPELANYFDTVFGIPSKHVQHILLLPIKDDRLGTHYWHADPDQNGLRIYLENDQTDNFLYIRPTNIPYNTKNESPTISMSWTDNDIQDVVHSASLLKPTQAFYINNIRAVHALNAKKINTQRITVAFGLDVVSVPELMNLVTESAVKYKDHAIFWSPPK